MLADLTTPEALSDQSTITRQVFLAMAGLELTAVEAPPVSNEASVASLLYYSEATEGAILVECTSQLAYTFTSRLMSIELPCSLDEDVADAMAELVNMIGGNLKGLMAAQTRISTPVILRDRELETLMLTNERLSRVCLSVDAGHCCVSLLKTHLC